jgi:hypothetical protein
MSNNLKGLGTGGYCCYCYCYFIVLFIIVIVIVIGGGFCKTELIYASIQGEYGYMEQ